MFALGSGLTKELTEKERRALSGVRVALRNFTDPPFIFLMDKERKLPLTYKELFLRCLNCWQILCLGLYRQNPSGSRYVLTNPGHFMEVYSSDMVGVLRFYRIPFV
ncbi:unnamed protein product [Protopolystoma xenopodis]|uniref:Ca2+-activated K+ channel Slowpoke-like C-terminal domain-containing protein n=1 Tax=Protopolystoma xenopodis TaxID=117903 RepID=A0A448WCC8_9PLAT|nr:unnamed protein product [Protopolystoma xenopodis]